METLRFYFDIVRNWWILMLAAALIGAFGAYVYSQQITPMYRTSTLLIVDQVEDPVTVRYQDVQMNENLTDTYAERITSRPVLQAIINELELNMGVGRLGSNISATPILNTTLVRVAVTDSDPARAAAVAEHLPEIFNQHDSALQASQFMELRAQYAEQLDVINADITNTQEEIRQLGNPATPAEQDQLEQLQANLNAHRSSYSMLLEKHGELRLAEAARRPQLLVDEPPFLPQTPVSPNVQMNTILGGLGGLALVIVAATGVAYLNVGYASEPKSAGDAPVVQNGESGSGVSDAGGNGKEIPTVALKGGSSGIELARYLLRNMLERGTEPSPRYLLVDAHGNGDAGEVTAATARTLASAGQSTIVVDYDLETPTIHAMFNVRPHQGLRLALQRVRLDEGAKLDEFLASTSYPNLRVLPGVEPGFANGLDLANTGDLLSQLSRVADVVLVKGPAVLDDPLCLSLAEHCDGTLLVADERAVGMSRLSEAFKRLRQAEVNVLAFVATHPRSIFVSTPTTS